MVDAKSIVIIGGQGLGDNLVQMVLGENARLAGYTVTMLSSIMCELRNWFPDHTFLPSIQSEQFETVLNLYDHVLWAHEIVFPASPELKERWISYEKFFDMRNNRIQNMALASSSIFRITNPTDKNGIIPPNGLQWRKIHRRVLIHPTSAEESKNWLPAKFLALAERLDQTGFKPMFVMSAQEVEEWKPIVQEKFPLVGFETVDLFARCLYESGYFIGNDSGGGHLASNLNIPTLSIHGRRGKAKDWRPGWGVVEIITPSFNLIGNYFRQHYWKYFLSTASVERAFKSLVLLSADMQEWAERK